MTKSLCGAERATTGVAVAGGEDRFGSALLFSDWRFDCKLSGKDTGGELCIYDTVRTGRGGPPTHVHFVQDEWFYVREGEYLFKIGNENFHLKRGDSLLAPRNVPHSFMSLSERSAMMVAFQPAGTIEQLFHDIAQVAKTRNLRMEDWQMFAPAHGYAVVGPPLTAEDAAQAMPRDTVKPVGKKARLVCFMTALLTVGAICAILIHGMGTVGRNIAGSLAKQADIRQHSQSQWIQRLWPTLPSL